MDNQIQRIVLMEEKLNKAKNLIDNLHIELKELDCLISELNDYYQSSDWMDDYSADEEGLLPIDLKRGVLSEDGINDLLEEYVSLKESLNNKGE